MLLVKSLQSALDLLAGVSFTDAFGGSASVDDYLWGKLHYVIFQSFLDGALNDTRIAGGGAFSIPAAARRRVPAGYARRWLALHRRRRQLRHASREARPISHSAAVQSAERRRDGSERPRAREETSSPAARTASSAGRTTATK